jgi:hypothetical protein
MTSPPLGWSFIVEEEEEEEEEVEEVGARFLSTANTLSIPWEMISGRMFFIGLPGIDGRDRREKGRGEKRG